METRRERKIEVEEICWCVSYVLPGIACSTSESDPQASLRSHVERKRPRTSPCTTEQRGQLRTLADEVPGCHHSRSEMIKEPRASGWPGSTRINGEYSPSSRLLSALERSRWRLCSQGRTTRSWPGPEKRFFCSVGHLAIFHDHIHRLSLNIPVVFCTIVWQMDWIGKCVLLKANYHHL